MLTLIETILPAFDTWDMASTIVWHWWLRDTGVSIWPDKTAAASTSVRVTIRHAVKARFSDGYS